MAVKVGTEAKNQGAGRCLNLYTRTTLRGCFPDVCMLILTLARDELPVATPYKMRGISRRLVFQALQTHGIGLSAEKMEA